MRFPSMSLNKAIDQLSRFIECIISVDDRTTCCVTEQRNSIKLIGVLHEYASYFF